VCRVVEHLYRQGDRLRKGLDARIQDHGLAPYVEIQGQASNLIYVTKNPEGERSQSYRTLFLQELIRRGIIAPSFVVSFSHSDQDIDRTIEAVDEALAVYAKACEEGVEKYLEGRAVKPVNRRYN
jgi:glutamate-1-semialdehyde 2,1-aminomutase